MFGYFSVIWNDTKVCVHSFGTEIFEDLVSLVSFILGCFGNDGKDGEKGSNESGYRRGSEGS